MTQIIGIAGFKRSGKGEAGNAIEAIASDNGRKATLLGFADSLKIAACRALGLTHLSEPDCIAYMDRFKEQGHMSFGFETGDVDERLNEFRTISGREYLQRFGTEVGRDLFGYDFWVDQVLPAKGKSAAKQLKEQYQGVDYVVLTDLRFPNEAQRVLDLGGEVWWVERPGVNAGAHVSEAGLDEKYITERIDNSGSLDDLHVAVKKALDL